MSKENYNDLKDIYNDINFMSCLVNQTGAYITSEISELKDMPISTFTTNEDEILYYKSSYTDNGNIYTILKTYDSEVIRDFDKYFSSKYDIYQTYSVNDSTDIYDVISVCAIFFLCNFSWSRMSALVFSDSCWGRHLG